MMEEVAQVHLKQDGEIIIHPRANEVVSASGEAALCQRNPKLSTYPTSTLMKTQHASLDAL